MKPTVSELPTPMTPGRAATPQRAGAAAFAHAVESHDWAAIARTLHPQIQFVGPTSRFPKMGEYDVMTAIDVLGIAIKDFRHTSMTGASEHPALHFTGRIGDVPVTGTTLLDVDDMGLVDRITVSVQPSRVFTSAVRT